MRRLTLLALLFLSSCDRAPTRDVRAERATLDRLPILARASAAHDSAMHAFATDLEAWSVRAGHPSSAEALVGPMMLRGASGHAMPPGSDTGVVADYQRLEVRFAALMRTRDSLRLAIDSARASVERIVFAQAKRALTTRTDSVLTPVFPTAIDDSNRFAPRKPQKCAIITVETLPSHEGVKICVLAIKNCSRYPGSDLWITACAYRCMDYIGWVPDGGPFSIGEK